MADQLMQDREHHRRQHLFAGAERDIAAAIVLNNLRVHILRGKIGRRIHMRDKPDYRRRPVDVGGQRAHHAAVIAERDIDKTKRNQLFLQLARQRPLPFAAGHLTRLRFCLRLYRHVT